MFMSLGAAFWSAAGSRVVGAHEFIICAFWERTSKREWWLEKESFEKSVGKDLVGEIRCPSSQKSQKFSAKDQPEISGRSFRLKWVLPG